MTETEARIINEFVAGADVPSLAARYSVSEEYVDHLVDQTHLDKPITVRTKRGTWSARGTLNRITYALVIGWFVDWMIRLAGNPLSAWWILPLAVVAWAVLTVGLVLVDRWHWSREHA